MASIPVRGRCPKCKAEHSTVADTGKVTWRGECPKRGCDGRIIARRVRDEKPDTPEGSSETDADDRPSPRRRTRKVIKVDGYAEGKPVKDKGSERTPDVSGSGTEPVREPEPGPSGAPGAGTAPDSSGGEHASPCRTRRWGRKSSRPVPSEGKRNGILGGYGDLY